MRPVRVVAPTSVNRGKVSRIERGRRALADHDVELEVLHRGVEDLLDGAGEAVDLVDEEHVALVELREDGGEVAGPFERGPRRDVEVHAHLGGDDAGERGLAEPGRAGEQQVVGGLAAPAGRLEDDGEVLLQLGLADELGEAARPEARPRRVSSSGPAPGRAALHARCDRQHLEGVAQQRGGIGAGGQVAKGVADLVGAVAEAGERLAHTACGGRGGAGTVGRGTRRRRARATSSRAFSSSSRRAAVFLPTPGTRHRASASSSATEPAEVARRVHAPGSRAPAPGRRRGRRGAPRSTPARRASGTRRGVCASSRTWWWTWRNDLGARIASVAERAGRRPAPGSRRR